MSELVGFLLRDVPADLKEALVNDARETERNVNDVVVGILARKFELSFEGTGRRSDSADGKNLDIGLRLPRELRVKINVRAKAVEESARDVMLRTLCEHYALRYVKKLRPRRRRRSAPTAAAA